MALSQRRTPSLLDAVGGAGVIGGRRTTLKTPGAKSTPHGKRTSPARGPIPVKPPVVKSLSAKTSSPPTPASRIPVTKPKTTPTPSLDVANTLSDLSWKFDSPTPDATAAAPCGRVGKPPIRPKTASLRRGLRKHDGSARGSAPASSAPPVAVRPSRSEEQAIHDLQELVRRQQEELEEYRDEPLASCVLVKQVASKEATPVDAVPDATAVNAGPGESRQSCTSGVPVDDVPEDASVDVTVDHGVGVDVGVEVVAEEPYNGPLQVKTVRLEDQDLPHDVLQDPRLAATRSRLNQRLQRLLDDVDDVVGDVLADANDARAHAAAVEDDVAVGDLLGLDPAPRTPPDPRRRSLYFTETPASLTKPPLSTLNDESNNWEPQEPRDSASRQVVAMEEWRGSEHAVDQSESRGSASKDQYHQEIRQLLQKLQSDDALFPYASTDPEPIYATAVKRKNRLPSQGEVLPAKDERQREVEGKAGKQKDVSSGTSISPMKQKAGGGAATTTLLPGSVRPRDHKEHSRMGPHSDDDGDSRQPGSDLSLSSDNTSGDDGIGEERPSRSWSGARSRGRAPGRDSVRDLSMDSGIQGSSCDLDVAESSTSTSTSSGSDHHEDEVIVEDLRPTPIGGCESQRSPALQPARPGETEPSGDLAAMMQGLGEAFKGVEELYVADVVPPLPPLPPAPEHRWGLAGPTSQHQNARIFTETHFDSAPNLSPLGGLDLLQSAGEIGGVFSSAPVGLDHLDSVANLPRLPQTNPADAASATSGHSGGVGSIANNVSLPNVQQVPFAHSASVSNLLAPHSAGMLLSPPEPFRRPHFREASGIAVLAARQGFGQGRQNRRFNSADDVFRASLLRHSLPAKPPRTPSVRASLDEDLSKQPYEGVPSPASVLPSAHTTTPSFDSSAQSHKVVVAIDFGTTYSGYAFCYTRDPDCNIHMMRKWEGGDPGLHNEKAPTAILLTPEGKFHSFGFLARDTFHDLQPDQAKRWMYFDKFKMALLSQTTLTRDTTLAAANGRQVPALTVLSMSLAHLRERALAELAAADQGDPADSSFGGDLTQDVRWVLTVPALWGPSATQLLREAAHMAGLASPDHPEALLIVLEPEAASLCCRQMRLHQLHSSGTAPDKDHPMASLVLDPGGHGARAWTQYMVVDCGGGTVDITVHELSGERATLRELHKASGGACGSLGVDREFERLLSAVFGADFMSHFRRKRPAAYVELLLSFEARKRSADPDRESTLTVFPPYAFVEAYRKFRGKEVEHAVRKFGRPGEISWSSQGMLRMSPQLMVDLFRPTLDQVCQQVEEVLRSPRLRAAPGAALGSGTGSAIQYLFLVGGFAQSLMLQNRVRSQFGSRVKVVVPQAVGLTTLRGAVLYGLDPSLVASRRSKHTLGVGVLKRFQPGQHPQDKLVTLSDGSKWCCDVLDVLVLADQALGPGEAVTRSYTPASARQTNIIIHIYCCTDANPPKFVTDIGVTRCGTLRLSLDCDVASSTQSKTREIVARIEFGGTELAASAQDLASGRCVRTQLDFLSTAV